MLQTIEIGVQIVPCLFSMLRCGLLERLCFCPSQRFLSRHECRRQTVSVWRGHDPDAGTGFVLDNREPFRSLLQLLRLPVTGHYLLSPVSTGTARPVIALTGSGPQ